MKFSFIFLIIFFSHLFLFMSIFLIEFFFLVLELLVLIFNEVFIRTQIFNKNIMCLPFVLSNGDIIVKFY